MPFQRRQQLTLALLLTLLAMGAWVLRGSAGERPVPQLEPVASHPPAAGRPADLAPVAPASGRAARAAEPDEAGFERTGSSAPRVFGRCIERDTNRPVPGVTLTLVVHGREPVAQRSAPDGSFEFESPGNIVSWLEVRRPSLWITERPRFRLTPEQRYGEDEMLVVLTRARQIFGRVVSSVTGEPLPDVKVTLSVDGGGFGHELTTAEDGTFVSRNRLPQARVFAHVRDARRTLPPAGAIGSNKEPYLRRTLMPAGTARRDKESRLLDPEHDADSEVAVEVGPTYRIELEENGLLVRPGDFGHVDVVLEQQSTPQMFWQSDPQSLRGEAPSWVRFREPIATAREGQRRLVVRSAKPRLVGSALVDPGPGPHPEPVRIQLRPAAAVWGRVLGLNGQPVDGAVVRVTQEGVSAAVVTRRNGTFGLPAAPRGRGRLSVTEGPVAVLEQEIDLLPGENNVGDLLLREASGSRTD